MLKRIYEIRHNIDIIHISFISDEVLDYFGYIIKNNGKEES